MDRIGKISQLPLHEHPIMISGGGFHAFWYGLGYGHAMLKKKRVPHIMGYSAGALAAVLLAFPELDCGTIAHVASGLVSECRIGHLDQVVKTMLTRLLPDDAHCRIEEGYVRIILCSCADYFRGRVEMKWESTTQLIDCVVASCFIPGIVSWARHDPVYGCIDGTFSRDLSSICMGHEEVGTINPGFCAKFHAITEEEAMDLFSAGESMAQKKFSNEAD